MAIERCAAAGTFLSPRISKRVVESYLKADDEVLSVEKFETAPA